MTDHKFTDDDVIKAYELCFTPKGTNETCAKCPFHKIGLLCKIERDRAALALINRQKAEIEGLQGELAVYRQQLETIPYTMEQIAEVAKIEAIKEFAERLKAKEAIHFCKCGQPFVYTDLFNGEIDNIVKEMTEENNE